MSKQQKNYFSNHFLIAMPGLEDALFEHAVIYICEHSEEGAIGIIINIPLDITLIDVLLQMKIKNDNVLINDVPIMFGGPVQQERGFVLHAPDKQWNSTLKLDKYISVTTSQDIIQAIATNEGPEKYLIALGYAGWEPEQLEKEIKENLWLSCPANPEVIFNTPFEKRWEVAARSLGFDINMMSGDAGHA